MTRREFVNITKDAEWIGNVTECEVRIERMRIDLTLDFRMFE